MRKFLANQHVSCKCGHAPRSHAAHLGSCEAAATRRLVGKADTSTPCGCPRYRPSLMDAVLSLF